VNELSKGSQANMDHLSLRKLSIIILIALSSIALIHGYSSIHVAEEIDEIQQSWSAFRSQNNEKARLVNSLYQVLGYGGMIHNFKNYILRKDFSHFIKVERSMGAAQAVVKQYIALGTSPTEKLVLSDIQTTLDHYQQAIILVRENMSDDSKSIEIDNLAKVDDELALRGLKLLQNEIISLHPFFADRTNKPVLASALYAEFGYGGMIHSFKNYILRRDVKHKKNALNSIVNIEGIIDEYKQLSPTTSEKTALEDITSVLKKYKSNIEVIDQGIEKKWSPEKIDTQVKISDTYALRGLKAIEQDIIYQIEKKSELLGVLIQDVHNREKQNAIIVITSTIFIAFFIYWVFTTKIISPVKNISRVMLKMSKGDINTPIYPQELRFEDDNTELGQMHSSLQVFKDNEIKRQIAEEKITRLALSDPLTGLANRNKFETSINEMVVLAKREEKLIALLALDLDKFKPINDEYGHAAGDLILKAVANNLLLIFRETDLVARLGGDEFSVILYGPDNIESITKTLQRVIALIPTSVSFGKDKLSVGVSIGVAFHQHNDNFDLDVLMNNADTALYQAKDAGRNTYRIFEQ
jgi:diguanylate cyclase (GGDEF)-like protein